MYTVKVRPTSALSGYHFGVISCWLAGLLLGACFGIFNRPYFSSWMRSVVIQPLSIVGVFGCLLLPLFVTCFSLRLNKPVYIYIICFLKALAYGFSVALIIDSFSKGAWLVCFLYLFSDTCYLPVLLWLWLYRWGYKRSGRRWDLWCCAFLGICIGLLDCLVISPFAQKVFL